MDRYVENYGERRERVMKYGWSDGLLKLFRKTLQVEYTGL